MAKNCGANLDPIRYFVSLFRRADTKYVCVHVRETERERENVLFCSFEKWYKVFCERE